MTISTKLGAFRWLTRVRTLAAVSFFICHEAQPHLDGIHTVFGKTEDMDVVNKIAKGDKIVSVKIED